MSHQPDLVIANATIVNSTGRREAHIVVSDGQIAALVDADRPMPAADRTIDATGKLVIPGGVDGHCHVAQVTGRFRTLDDYRTTSTAALWGGTTTIIDFGIPRDAQESPLAAVLHKKELATQSRCDVALHGAVVSWDETVPWQLEQLAAEGVRSVKMYTTNRGTTMADGDTILKVMREMVRLDGLAYIHAEGYAAGELKHGPIALIDENVPVIVMAPEDDLFEKSISNLQEVAARGGQIILISNADPEKAGCKLAAHIRVPTAHDFANPLLYAVPAQLIAYHTAVTMGTDVDQPRNLAKSVTVE